MAKQWEGWGASRQHGNPPAYAPAWSQSGLLTHGQAGIQEYIHTHTTCNSDNTHHLKYSMHPPTIQALGTFGMYRNHYLNTAMDRSKA